MEREVLSTCGELAHGDVVQAYVANVLQFCGCVTEIHIEREIFWTADGIGQRRAVDLASYTVYRLYPPFL